ncbi:hypothetical protein B7P43_G00744 [Cryptotermes secundus]|uniref:Uncharacterized protein n=1 Tax=Cryptotermes secundus TaxID=105785 RepID=A0A2J7Q7U6_9NEOP|nr:hypothetical protein B7P43_G00744 [Cryptotermes secundus]
MDGCTEVLMETKGGIQSTHGRALKAGYSSCVVCLLVMLLYISCLPEMQIEL